MTRSLPSKVLPCAPHMWTMSKLLSGFDFWASFPHNPRKHFIAIHEDKKRHPNFRETKACAFFEPKLEIPFSHLDELLPSTGSFVRIDFSREPQEVVLGKGLGLCTKISILSGNYTSHSDDPKSAQGFRSASGWRVTFAGKNLCLPLSGQLNDPSPRFKLTLRVFFGSERGVFIFWGIRSSYHDPPPK